MSLRFQNVTIDCNDALRVGTFWAELLNLPLGADQDGTEYPNDRDAEVARALALGATHIDIGQGTQTWVVLADPEGNEFCILRALRADEK